MLFRTICIGLALSFAVGCKPDESVSCQAITQMTVPISCYQSGAGLSLTAVTGQVAMNIKWIIFPLNDTTSLVGQSYTPVYMSTSTNVVTIPDSLASKYPKLGVYGVPQDCSSAKQSLYFGFVKRTQSGGTCQLWQLQERYGFAD